MAYRKRSSQVVEQAKRRAAALSMITPEPQFGGNVSLAQLQMSIAETEAAIEAHNKMLAAADNTANTVDLLEGKLKDLNIRMLKAVAVHYGPDSSEYEMVGGTRTSDRKRPVRKTVEVS